MSVTTGSPFDCPPSKTRVPVASTFHPVTPRIVIHPALGHPVGVGVGTGVAEVATGDGVGVLYVGAVGVGVGVGVPHVGVGVYVAVGRTGHVGVGVGGVHGCAMTAEEQHAAKPSTIKLVHRITR